MHIRNKVNGRILQECKIKNLIENIFGAKVRLQQGRIYRIDSATLAKFFETFFIYNYAWKPLNDSKVNKLRDNWNNV